MKVRYAKKNEKEIAIKFWKESFKSSLGGASRRGIAAW